MCDERLLVPIPDWLEAVGGIHQFDPTHPEYGLDDQGRRCLRLDRCLVPAIEALWERRIVTTSCCCGHGEGPGSISLPYSLPRSAVDGGERAAVHDDYYLELGAALVYLLDALQDCPPEALYRAQAAIARAQRALAGPQPEAAGAGAGGTDGE